MEQHRLVGANEEMIEGESRGRGDLGDMHGQAIDAVGDFIGFGLHGLIGVIHARDDRRAASSRARMNAETSSAALADDIPACVSAA